MNQRPSGYEPEVICPGRLDLLVFQRFLRLRGPLCGPPIGAMNASNLLLEDHAVSLRDSTIAHGGQTGNPFQMQRPEPPDNRPRGARGFTRQSFEPRWDPASPRSVRRQPFPRGRASRRDPRTGVGASCILNHIAVGPTGAGSVSAVQGARGKTMEKCTSGRRGRHHVTT